MNLRWLLPFRPRATVATGLRAAARGVAVSLAMLAALSISPAAQAASQCKADWPLWQQFAKHFVAPDGRVIDASIPEMHSTSEGQSYGMFFALVANDRPAFDRM